MLVRSAWTGVPASASVHCCLRPFIHLLLFSTNWGALPRCHPSIHLEMRRISYRPCLFYLLKKMFTVPFGVICVIYCPCAGRGLFIFIPNLKSVSASRHNSLHAKKIFSLSPSHTHTYTLECYTLHWQPLRESRILYSFVEPCYCFLSEVASPLPLPQFFFLSFLSEWLFCRHEAEPRARKRPLKKVKCSASSKIRESV